LKADPIGVLNLFLGALVARGENPPCFTTAVLRGSCAIVDSFGANAALSFHLRVEDPTKGAKPFNFNQKHASIRTETNAKVLKASTKGSQISKTPHANLVGPSDAVFINPSQQACIPGTANGTFQKWFGRGHSSDNRSGDCIVFGDGYINQSNRSDAIFIGSGQQACVPSGTAQDTCQKWWGRCEVH
jgi:hypothetical protein